MLRSLASASFSSLHLQRTLLLTPSPSLSITSSSWKGVYDVTTLMTKPQQVIMPQRSFATIKQHAWFEAVSLAPGDEVVLRRTFTAADGVAFGALSGDYNAVHYADRLAQLQQTVVAQTTSGPHGRPPQLRFDRPITHGMVSASLFSGMFGSHLPGSIYLAQNLKFVAPVYYDEEIQATIKVLEIVKKRVKCQTIIEKLQTQSDGTIKKILAVDGDAWVLVDALVTKADKKE